MPAPRKWHEQDLVLNDFSGGENSQDSEIVLQPNELSECENVLGDKRGALRRRKGITKFNSTEIPGSPTNLLNGLTKFYDSVDGDGVIVMQYGGGILYRVPATGASVDLGLDHDDAANFNYAPTAGRTQFQQYRTRMYGTVVGAAPFVIAPNPSGNSNLLAWAMGVAVPTKAGTHAESDTTGLLTAGVYLYKLAYFYGEDGAHGESNPSASSTITITGSNDTNTITIWANDANHQYDDWDEAHDAGVDKVRIYRTEVDGSNYYFLADVTSGNTYVDLIADAALDDTTLPQADNYTAPEAARFISLQNDRLFLGYLTESSVSHARRVRWSLAGSPDIWPLNNYADAPAEHGEITGMKVVGGQLYVFFKSAIARLTI